MIERISAVTLVTRDMGPAVRFYRALGFLIRHGGEAASFTSFAVGSGYLNLVSGSSRAPQTLQSNVGNETARDVSVFIEQPVLAYRSLSTKRGLPAMGCIPCMPAPVGASSGEVTAGRRERERC